MDQRLNTKSQQIPLSTKVSCKTCSISQLCLPSALDSSEVSRLEEIINRGTSISKGEFLSQAGDQFLSIWAVSSGSFKAYTLAEDGDINITGFYFPGELIGLDAISTGEHNNYVKALETSAVCKVPFEKLDDLSGEIKSLRKQMLKIMSNELIDDQNLLMLLSRKNASERMAAFILSLSLRFKQRGFSEKAFNLTMTRSDIANYLGLAIETVSRLLTQLQKDNILKIEDKLVEIIDSHALVNLAGASCDAHR